MRPDQLIGKKSQIFPKVGVHCKNLKYFKNFFSCISVNIDTLIISFLLTERASYKYLVGSELQTKEDSCKAVTRALIFLFLWNKIKGIIMFVQMPCIRIFSHKL